MFTANLKGTLQRNIGRDIHGRHTLGPSIPCPFGPVNLEIGAAKTSARADSSASRGSADQTSVGRGKILIPPFMTVANNDVFTFKGVKYEIVSAHPRYSTSGHLDHYECDLESLVG
jgi:hypothetical protein